MSKDDWKLTGFVPTEWPSDEEGEPERPVLIRTEAGMGMDGDLTMNLLKAYGVPVFYKYPLDGSFGKVIAGIAGAGVEIFVPASFQELALALINGEAQILDEEGFDVEDEEE